MRFFNLIKLAIVFMGVNISLSIYAQDSNADRQSVATEIQQDQAKVGVQKQENDQEDELDILITVVSAHASPMQAIEMIVLPPYTPAQKRGTPGLDKANTASAEARSQAQERINNILGDSVPGNAIDKLPADVRKVVPARPPKSIAPPKPAKGKPGS